MYRIGLVLLGCWLAACNGKQKNSAGEEAAAGNASSAGFSLRFNNTTLPYQLTDTALRANNDTALLSANYLTSLLSDSTVKQVFGKAKGIRYTPLVKVQQPGKETYYIVKGAAGPKEAAFLLVFDQKGNYNTAIPFLVLDSDPSVLQTSTIDKSYTVTKAIIQRSNGAVTGEGKDVLAYDPASRKFTLIMTDLLNDNPAVLVNPLDTFPKSNRLAGDYYKNSKNLIAVRDGRHPNQILVYIHAENSDGDCKGELKGEFILTSSKSAVYRQPGDPCILSLDFAGNAVTLNEERGCGNYRGLDCPFNGTFTRKKEGKSKETMKKTKRSH